MAEQASIRVRGDKLTVTLPGGRSATVPFDLESSIISPAGKAAIRIATAMAEGKQ